MSTVDKNTALGHMALSAMPPQSTEPETGEKMVAATKKTERTGNRPRSQKTRKS